MVVTQKTSQRSHIYEEQIFIINISQLASHLTNIFYQLPLYKGHMMRSNVILHGKIFFLRLIFNLFLHTVYWNFSLSQSETITNRPSRVRTDKIM